MRRIGAAVALLALVAAAGASAGTYQLAATQACLTHMGLNVSLETPVPASLQNLEPYGSLGGLRWKASATAAILIEFGKSPSEANAMLKAVVKLVGKSAAAGGAVAKGNVMFYTNDIKLTSSQTSTVVGCLH